MARPTGLIWIGPLNHKGRPAHWVAGIPARTLNESDLGQLSDAQIAAALASGFYELPGGKPAKTTTTAAAADDGEE